MPRLPEGPPEGGYPRLGVAGGAGVGAKGKGTDRGRPSRQSAFPKRRALLSRPSRVSGGTGPPLGSGASVQRVARQHHGRGSGGGGGGGGGGPGPREVPGRGLKDRGAGRGAPDKPSRATPLTSPRLPRVEGRVEGAADLRRPRVWGGRARVGSGRLT